MVSRNLAVSASVKSRTRVSRLTPFLFKMSRLLVSPMPKIERSAYSIRLSRGRSTPAIRAKDCLLVTQDLALPLLVLLDNADNAHDAVALYYLAFITDFFNRCSDFHLYSTPRLGLGPISFAPPRAHIIYNGTKFVPG